MNFMQGDAARVLGAQTIGIRPEHLALSTTGGQWPGKILLAEHLGSDTFLHVDGGALGRITVRAPGEFPLGPGSHGLDDARSQPHSSLRLRGKRDSRLR